ncbi:hypothetical protein B0I37DRAFT_439316 [Chaetomium sp. MPI-CAGE-AT-0009]|nr:hypothetical protein B0I37DRAFT_439316 [Chaetomium sp. MPI-CAGE-AT-0009]
MSSRPTTPQKKKSTQQQTQGTSSHRDSPPRAGPPPAANPRVNSAQQSPPRGNPPRGGAVPVAPPPPPPPPLAATRRPAPQVQQRPKTPPENSIGIGIETEFFLESRQNETHQSLRPFAKAMVEKYNAYIGASSRLPKMHSLVGDLYRGPYGMRHTEWALHHDPTCETANSPWGIELVSPILTAYQGGGVWRESVTQIWRFLELRYRVSANESCSTHVHLSLAGGFSLPQLKRLAQAVIYFECAYARSNWIDNKHLAYKNLTRDQSMLKIEACKTQGEVIQLMNPDGSRYFGVNFLALEKYKTVEFRRGAASTKLDDVFKWVEFAMTFLQASIQLSAKSDFSRFQPTVGGLRKFFDNARLVEDPGMNQRKYLNLLFQSHKPEEKAEPIPVRLETLSKEKRAKLSKKVEADKLSNPMLDKISDATQDGLL